MLGRADDNDILYSCDTALHKEKIVAYAIG